MPDTNSMMHYCCQWQNETWKMYTECQQIAFEYFLQTYENSNFNIPTNKKPSCR